MVLQEDARSGSELPPMEIFCFYAHEDEPLRRELEQHLSSLTRQGVATLWHDRLITPGAHWSQSIDTHLETASVFLLLISSSFLASDYYYGAEMQRALQRHKVHEALVIPIVLRPCDWHAALFASLQILPAEARPVTSWPDRDEAWTDVVRGLRVALKAWPQPVVAARASGPSVKANV